MCVVSRNMQWEIGLSVPKLKVFILPLPPSHCVKCLQCLCVFMSVSPGFEKVLLIIVLVLHNDFNFNNIGPLFSSPFYVIFLILSSPILFIHSPLLSSFFSRSTVWPTSQTSHPVKLDLHQRLFNLFRDRRRALMIFRARVWLRSEPLQTDLNALTAALEMNETRCPCRCVRPCLSFFPLTRACRRTPLLPNHIRLHELKQ